MKRRRMINVWGRLRIRRVGDFEFESFEDLEKLVHDKDVICKFK